MFTLLLAEGLRVVIGNQLNAVDNLIYGLLLILFIIYMPNGILGRILERMRGR